MGEADLKIQKEEKKKEDAKKLEEKKSCRDPEKSISEEESG